MSKENINEMGGSNSTSTENTGFSVALLINLEGNFDESHTMKELNEGLDNLRFNSTDTPTTSDAKNENMKNYISSDLLQRLEQNSPIKSEKNSMDFKKEIPDIYNMACSNIQKTEEGLKRQDDNSTEALDRKINAVNQEIRNEENSVDSGTSSSFRNFRLKTQIIKASLNQAIKEEESSNGIASPNQQNIMKQCPQIDLSAELGDFPKMVNEKLNELSPELMKTQPLQIGSSPLYTYYTGINKFSSLKKDEQEKIPSFVNNNFIGLENSTNYIKKIGVDKLEALGSHDKNMSSQMDYRSMNTGCANVNKDIYGKYGYQFGLDMLGNQNRNCDGQSPFEGNNENTNFEGSDMKVPQNNSRILLTTTQGGSRPSQFANKNIEYISNTSKSNLSDTTDDYIVEMFGRKGWICDKCSNFNYETRIKCNRCGVPKCPKRNIKGKFGNKSDSSTDKRPGAETNISFEGDSSSDKTKKKSFVERVGDWVCIKCKNLNFSFRVVCNRCQLPKVESEKMFDCYMSNLMIYMQMNCFQNQMMNNSNNHLQQSYFDLNNFVNNSGISINNPYYTQYNNQCLLNTQNQNNHFNVFNGLGNIGNSIQEKPDQEKYSWMHQDKPINPNFNPKMNLENNLQMKKMNAQTRQSNMNNLNNPLQIGENFVENDNEDERIS